MKPPSPESRIQTLCLCLLTAVAVGAAVHWLQPVLVPFVLALFVAVGLSPVVEVVIRRLRLGRIPSVIIVLVLGIALLAALGLLISLSIGQLVANVDAYQQRVQDLIAEGLDSIHLERFGVQREQLRQKLAETAGQSAGALLGATARSVQRVLANGGLVLVFVCFLMLGAGGTTRDLGPDWRAIEFRIRRYIAVKALLSVATGVLVGLCLWILGIDFAVVFGLLAFLLNFIPSIGSVVAVLLPIPVILLDPEVSVAAAVLAIALPGAVEMVIGNVIEPRMMGKSFDLHPITVLMALIFWGMLWGIIGMLLATPVTAVTKILLEKHPLTRPVAEVLAGRVGKQTAQGRT